MSFWYLASPYDKFPRGKFRAHAEVCVEAARLILAGVPTFSPIAHSHSISYYGGIPAGSHEIWLPADQPFIDAARGLIMLRMDGWDKSVGMGYELQAFTDTARPVVYMDVGTIPDVLLRLYGNRKCNT